jgi:hypothetical protein
MFGVLTMKIVKINADAIIGWDSFHDLFSKKFGFLILHGSPLDKSDTESPPSNTFSTGSE